MDIYIYSDESGVLDKKYNEYYVYGGLIFLNKEDKDGFSRKYKKVEKRIRGGYGDVELKACKIQSKHKTELYRASNGVIRFVIYIEQINLRDRVFEHKKTKQRYLDYMYKVGLKRVLSLLKRNIGLDLTSVRNIHIFQDEHTTATNGKYNLRESIYEEFRYGMYNPEYNRPHPPICENLKGVHLKYLDSKNSVHIRASDIIANRHFNDLRNGKGIKLEEMNGWERYGNPIVVRIL